MKVIDKLINELSMAAVYNPDIQVAPVCILWPDKERQWESIIPRLQSELPQLFVLGNYEPEKRQGPAIWLRCAVDKLLPDHPIAEDQTPILYLPGFSRQDLRDIRNCSDEIKFLVELQYRGCIWSQINAKDWTILAFAKTDQGGLGLDVALDNETKNAMLVAVGHFLDEEIELIKGKRLDKDYFNKLLVGGDYIKDLLQWINQAESFKQSKGDAEWEAFVQVIKSLLNFNPANKGHLAAAELLAKQQGAWKPVFDRFAESPQRYQNIPAIIKQCKAPEFNMFSNIDTDGGWPQFNDKQEDSLRDELIGLAKITDKKAREHIKHLESIHGDRRKTVWSELGMTPLANALENLSQAVHFSSNSLAAGTLADLEQGYLTTGWQVDAAILKSLYHAESDENFKAISAAIRAIYIPWLEGSAQYLQKTVVSEKYPGTNNQSKPQLGNELPDSTCFLFIDGLRFDTAKMLEEILTQKNIALQFASRWCAIPSVTSTAKPAISPVSYLLTGLENTSDFEPVVATTGQSLKGGYQFKKLLSDNDWKVLERTDNGDGNGRAWCEFGNLDHEGHDRGWKLARQLNILLKEIAEKIDCLLSAGWKNIRVVTDHGWLLLPGGLPKIDLPKALTDSKWGRCASIKEGAITEVTQYEWFWNRSQFFALCQGISCYKTGEDYAHGGLSLQECLIPDITIAGKTTSSKVLLNIIEVTWSGLRCRITVDGNYNGLRLDLRSQPGNSNTTVALEIREISGSGKGSIIVDDDSYSNQEAYLVILDSENRIVAQKQTIIGGKGR